jgi:hypothetical protein
MQQDNYDKDIQRLEQRIDFTQSNYATLRDVDRRFAEDRARIQALEAKQMENGRMYIEIVDRINLTFDTKLANGLKPIAEQIGKLEGKIDSVKDRHSESTTLTLRYIVSVIVSFVLGSGVIGAFQYFESVIRK